MLKNLLNGLTDKQLIRLVKKGDSEAFQEICRRYENIFYKVCQKYTQALTNSGLNVSDIFEEKNCIIYHCINTFDARRKTKLSSWIGNFARYLCLNSISSRKFLIPNFDRENLEKLEEIKSTQNYLALSHTPEDFNYVINLVNQFSDKRILEIFSHRYLSDKKLNWSVIAKKLGISCQTAINLNKIGLNLLKKKLKSENISDVI